MDKWVLRWWTLARQSPCRKTPAPFVRRTHLKFQGSISARSWKMRNDRRLKCRVQIDLVARIASNSRFQLRNSRYGLRYRWSGPREWNLITLRTWWTTRLALSHRWARRWARWTSIWKDKPPIRRSNWTLALKITWKRWPGPLSLVVIPIVQWMSTYRKLCCSRIAIRRESRALVTIIQSLWRIAKCSSSSLKAAFTAVNWKAGTFQTCLPRTSI